MQTKGNTVLITGGATGIGFSLAQAFVKAGNSVLICGRRAVKLEMAQKSLPGIAVRQCDLTKKQEREALFRWVKEEHPDTNILVNNAGIQRSIDLTRGATELTRDGDEIQTNLAAPIHLCALFAKWLSGRDPSAIVNVSSGLGFVPIASMPVYCASKAGLHTFSVSLRYQLKNTPVKVFEIIPPAVDTELGQDSTSETEQEYRGIPPAEVAEAVLKGLKNDEYEIAVGEARDLMASAKKNFSKVFEQLNSW